MEILIIIPARGGSKGIPRKNLRSLNGSPLIAYAIRNGLSSKYQADVYVSSEDEEILTTALKLKSKTHQRDAALADDNTTLDPVIYRAFEDISSAEGKEYDLVITLQPTSPLLKTSSLDGAIEMMMEDPELDTVISAVEDTHLRWTLSEGRHVPDYEDRVNRQFLPPSYKETGGFMISRTRAVSDHTRIGKNVQLFLVTAAEGIDIDNYEDWNLCEYLLRKKTLLFVVTGYPEVGLGHVYNTLILAHEILDHRIIFLLDKKSQLGYEKILEQNFETHLQQSENILDDIAELKPEIVINDILDSSKEYIGALKQQNIVVINFEDLGPGAELADMVVNSIYPEEKEYAGHYYGPQYFCARNEFLLTPDKEISPKVSRVLITFGGVDPNNLTLHTLESIYDLCNENGIKIQVVTGLGYGAHSSLKKFDKADILKDVTNISDHMLEADLAFTSAGRTTYELALLGVPSIILAQNERELTHFFSNEEHGFINLGLGSQVEKTAILTTFKNLVNNFESRQKMHRLMLNHKIRKGKKNVMNKIRNLIEK